MGVGFKDPSEFKLQLGSNDATDNVVQQQANNIVDVMIDYRALHAEI